MCKDKTCIFRRIEGKCRLNTCKHKTPVKECKWLYKDGLRCVLGGWCREDCEGDKNSD